LTDNLLVYTESPEARSFALPRIPETAGPSTAMLDAFGQNRRRWNG
jgi:hypothetical protein